MNPHNLTDADFLVLLAVSVGHGLDVVGGALCIPDPAAPDSFVPVAGDTLDRLEGAEMVEIAERGAELTDRGRYHLGRWMGRRYRRRTSA